MLDAAPSAPSEETCGVADAPVASVCTCMSSGTYLLKNCTAILFPRWHATWHAVEPLESLTCRRVLYVSAVVADTIETCRCESKRTGNDHCQRS
jgi:hypothetical protein